MNDGGPTSSAGEAVSWVRERIPFAGIMDGPLHAHTSIARTVLRHLEPGSRILDFGSGFLDKTAVLQRLGFRCSACDDLLDYWYSVDENRQRIAEFAAAMGIDFRITNGSSLPFQKDSFDMVMLHDVLEHLHDSPRDLLNKLLSLTKEGGYLFVTVPNAANIRKRIAVLFGGTNHPPFDAYFWHPGTWRGHMREYVRGDLRSLAEYLGLSAVELRSCHHMLNRLPRSVRPFYILATACFPGWRDTWRLVARKPEGWTMRNLGDNEYENLSLRTTTYRR